jgi:hypothetical protein
VLEKYPAHDLAGYAMLALANGLSWERYAESLELLHSLELRAPSFRKLESTILVAKNYRCMRNPDAGLAMLSPVVGEAPAVADNFEFVQAYLSCRYPGAAAGQAMKAWKERRLEGVANAFEMVE